MMEYVQDMLGLPVHTLAVLAAGYLSYRLAYTGRDATHKTIDVIFLVFVYAFVARLSAGLVVAALMKTNLSLQVAQAGASLSGLMIALCVAAYWRRLGAMQIFELLRKLGISFSDRHLSAWESIIMNESIEPSSMVIRKKDGSMVMSEALADFNDLPYGPCIQGPDGSVALYITHKWPVGADAWEERDPAPCGDLGGEVTIIPASEIAEISMRAD